MESRKEFIRGLKEAWREEVSSARNYRALAEKEQNPDKRGILLRMAEAEDRHAERWAQRLEELGEPPGEFQETVAERIRRRVLLRSDAQTAAKMLEEGEAGADKLYDSLLAHSQSEEDRKNLVEIRNEERAHQRVLEGFENPAIMSHPQSQLERILRREKWHVRAGGWIGQAIYGLNDGLGASFGVVSGIAGATSVNSEFILLSGFATMIASALSMGSGAYLAMKSEREVYEAEIERERREIEENPEEEIEEMQLFYQLKGFSEAEAKTMTEKLAAQPDNLLKTLAHEELGLSEQSFPNEWRSAISATISTAIGAAIPVLPFLFSSGMTGLAISFVVSTAAHFVIGASKVVVTGRSWLKSGTEMTVVGIGEAAVTYVIGRLIAPVIG